VRCVNVIGAVVHKTDDSLASNAIFLFKEQTKEKSAPVAGTLVGGHSVDQLPGDSYDLRVIWIGIRFHLDVAGTGTISFDLASEFSLVSALLPHRHLR
jgi:hypothetical protein